jgi:uncharacterized protein (DUF927 family)
MQKGHRRFGSNAQKHQSKLGRKITLFSALPNEVKKQNPRSKARYSIVGMAESTGPLASEVA